MSWILVKVFFGSSSLGFVRSLTIVLKTVANGSLGYNEQSTAPPLTTDVLLLIITDFAATWPASYGMPKR